MNIYHVRFWLRRTSEDNIDIDTYVVAESAVIALTKFIGRHPEDLNVLGEYTVNKIDKEHII